MNKRNVLIMSGAATLLLLAILVGAFFAGPLMASANSTNNSSKASSTPTTTNPYCQQYLQDLANRLHVSVSTLEQDKLAAHEDVLAQMVKDGKLTQAQADAIQKSLTSHQACTGKNHGSHFVIGFFIHKYGAGIVSDVASGLHLSVAQLKADLQAGKSLSDVATAQHVSASQLQTIVTTAIQNGLKKAVSAGDLTSAQETTITQMLQKHPQFLDKILHAHMGKQ